MVCLYLSLSGKDLPWGQLVALGDRCAPLPDVLSLTGCHFPELVQKGNVWICLCGSAAS